MQKALATTNMQKVVGHARKHIILIIKHITYNMWPRREKNLTDSTEDCHIDIHSYVHCGLRLSKLPTEATGNTGTYLLKIGLPIENVV